MTRLDQLEYIEPAAIEARSFQIIGEQLKDRTFPSIQHELVVKRVIHTSADFDYADSLTFSRNAIEAGVSAILGGASIVTDTQMAAAGINKRVLAHFGGTVLNFVSDESVAAEAKERGLTRSAVAIERATSLEGPLVFALGNAPTALIRLCQLLADKSIATPALVIGVPVGFVNVVESKEALMELPVDYIVARGRKGGSNIAAAICNALIYIASGDQRE